MESLNWLLKTTDGKQTIILNNSNLHNDWANQIPEWRSLVFFKNSEKFQNIKINFPLIILKLWLTIGLCIDNLSKINHHFRQPFW